jgi:hypothetical protein
MVFRIQGGGRVAFRAGGLFKAQAFRDPINAAAVQQNAGGDAGVFLACVLEFECDLGEAGAWDDGQFRVVLDEGAVGAKTVAFKVASE